MKKIITLSLSIYLITSQSLFAVKTDSFDLKEKVITLCINEPIPQGWTADSIRDFFSSLHVAPTAPTALEPVFSAPKQLSKNTPELIHRFLQVIRENIMATLLTKMDLYLPENADDGPETLQAFKKRWGECVEPEKLAWYQEGACEAINTIKNFYSATCSDGLSIFLDHKKLSLLDSELYDALASGLSCPTKSFDLRKKVAILGVTEPIPQGWTAGTIDNFFSSLKVKPLAPHIIEPIFDGCSQNPPELIRCFLGIIRSNVIVTLFTKMHLHLPENPHDTKRYLKNCTDQWKQYPAATRLAWYQEGAGEAMEVIKNFYSTVLLNGVCTVIDYNKLSSLDSKLYDALTSSFSCPSE
jgi:hypothetical protein